MRRYHSSCINGQMFRSGVEKHCEMWWEVNGMLILVWISGKYGVKMSQSFQQRAVWVSYHLSRLNFLKLCELCIIFISGSGSSVGIANVYGLDGPGSNPGGDEIFHTSRPALAATQPPVKWVAGLSRGLSAAGAYCWPLTTFWCRSHGRVELYLYPPSGPNRACNGKTLPFI